MEITEVRFANAKPKPSGNGVCGLCSVSLDNLIVIHGVKVKMTNSKLSVFLPARKVGDNDKTKPVVTFMDYQFKQDLTKTVIDAYLKIIEQHPKGYWS